MSTGPDRHAGGGALVRFASSPFAGSPWERVRYFALIGFLLICLFGGGASRADVLSLLYLRPAAILCLLVMVATPGEWDFRRVRTPLILLGLFAATMLVQLIPLPPDLWASLPGFSRYTEAAAAAGIDQPWRPISLTPDLTLNSLLALLPCLVALVGFAGIREDQRRGLLSVLVGFVAANAMLSVAQFAGGPQSPAYLYAITNSDEPVGFFSNRNHNATLLALAFPLLAVWTTMAAPSRQYQRTRNWIALAFGLFLIPLILATGSRAGIVAGAVGIGAALWLAPPLGSGLDPRWRNALRLGLAAAALLLVFLTVYTDRAVSIFRMTGASALAADPRFESFSTLMDMLRTFSPQGIGYGAFDPVFRGFEPDWMLTTQYFNHAHNDLVELALTGGVAAVLLLLAFLLWWARRMFQVTLRGDRARTADRLARLGGVMILILLGTSLVDYPLRTPLLATIFTLACCWLTPPRTHDAVAPAAEAAPDRKRKARRPRGPGPVRILTAIVLAGAIGWLAVGVTWAGVFGRTRPSLVTWWSLDATARATRASRAMETGTRPTRAALAAAMEEARGALRREPVNALAARALALLQAAQGREAEANQLMRYSEMLSRRDVPTQLWMIESSVRRNDIDGALLHYDRALRTSQGYREVLLPILIDAASSDSVAPKLARLVATRPNWWEVFTGRLVSQGRSAAAIETVLTALRLDPAAPQERALLAGAIGRLVALGDYPRALALYRRAGGAADALVRNGDFERDGRFVPLDWVLGDGGGAGSIMQPVPGASGRGLLMVVEAGSAGGTVARQLLVLPPGAYRFGAVAGRITGEAQERPRITLACVRTNATLFDLRLPVAGERGDAVSTEFTVGGACPAQWLVIAAPRPTGENGPWLDRISVQPR